MVGVNVFSLIDEDPTLSGGEGLTGEDVERILDRLEQLSDQISEISRVVSVLRASDANFWGRDWPALIREMAEHKASIISLERRLDEAEKKAIEQKTLAVAVSKQVEEHEKLKNKVLAWAAALGAGGAGLVELLSRALK